jgi:hypothetical protein
MNELKSSASGRVMWGFVSGVGIQAAEYTKPIRKGKGSLALSREVQIQPSMGNTPSLAVLILADGFARRVATDVVRYSMDVTP